jgi:hypothetical protein
MSKTLPIFLGALLLLNACSKHEDELRAKGLREISGKVFLVVEGQPNLPLAQAKVMVADWDECVRNFKQLKDKHAAGKEKRRLEINDYWQVLGNAINGVKTDAAGVFEMTVPGKQSLVLCASAAYTTPEGGLAKGFWLIRLNEAPVQRIDLSNRNSLSDVQTVEDMIIVN